MYNDTYGRHGATMKVSIVQIVMISMILAVALFIPMLVISSARDNETQNVYTSEQLRQREQSGNVAGAATEGYLNVPLTSLRLDLDTETGLLVLTGGVMLTIAVVLSIYLLATRKDPRR